ncbi:hypothetical protein PoB_001721700 [Plakobranchus ocellatus]|uniref:Uncharacterized protein n=1 Tax=Plakobranchus ocellatus TaxID=259542 RepID=A0AAV3Z870_9GAST|nr:hypothetical protein PoB_001721700 [Plakobranchus ocellatus]
MAISEASQTIRNQPSEKRQQKIEEDYLKSIDRCVERIEHDPAHFHHNEPDHDMYFEELTASSLTGSQSTDYRKDMEADNIDHQSSTLDNIQPNKNANFTLEDTKHQQGANSEKRIDTLNITDKYQDDESFIIKSDTSVSLSVGSVVLHQYSSALKANAEIIDAAGTRQNKNIETALHFLQRPSYGPLSKYIETSLKTVNEADCEAIVGGQGVRPSATLSSTAPGTSSWTSSRNKTTQTDGPKMLLTSSRGTMTDAYGVDCCVSTHRTPCRLVRHYGTATTGPFMKKLRRAQRLFVEAKMTSRSNHASTVAKWRKVLDKFKQKMETMTCQLAKKDEMMGSTSSRVIVLQGDIKDAMLAVRSST